MTLMISLEWNLPCFRVQGYKVLLLDMFGVCCVGP